MSIVSLLLGPAYTLATKMSEATLHSFSAAITEGLFYFVEIMGHALKIFAALLFAMSAFIFGFILKLNFEILDPTSPTYKFISTGWTVVRDIANLGFVLFIILIALATIVRYRDYEAKKTLPKLIGAAILVNFSLAMPTVFINFTNIISNYFMSFESTKECSILPDGLGKRTCDLTVHMGATLQPQKFIIPPKFNENDLSTALGGVQSGVLQGLLKVGQPYLATMFLMGGVFIMVCYALLFLWRFVYLHFLLVIAPITWLFWVIPQTQGMFSKWWTKFVQFCFFAPASLFFLYLIIYTSKGMYSATAGVKPEAYVGFLDFQGDVLMDLVRIGAINFVMLGFLIGGLVAAQSMSIHGASGMIGLAKNTGKKAREWAQKKATTGGQRAVGSSAGMKLATNLQNRNNPVLKGVGNWLQNKSYGYDQKFQKEAEKKAQGITRGGDPELAAAALEGSIMPRMRAELVKLDANKYADLEKNLKNAKEELKDTPDPHDTDSDIFKQTRWAARNKREIEALLGPKNASLSAEITEAERKLKTESRLDERNKLKERIASLTLEKNQNTNKIEAAVKKREKAIDTFWEAKEKRKEAVEGFQKAQVAMNEYERNVLSKLPPNYRTQIKDSKGDISKTTLPGSQKARADFVPELSTKKLEKNVKELKDTIERYKKIQNDPISTDAQRKEAKIMQEQYEKNHNLAETQLNKFKGAQEEWEKVYAKRQAFIKRGGTKDDPEFDNIQREFETARTNYWGIARGNTGKEPDWKKIKNVKDRKKIKSKSKEKESDESEEEGE